MPGSQISGWIRPFFAIAAFYDIVLGLGVLLFFRRLYESAGIPLPNHDAYVQFAASVVLVFGIGFAMVAREPRAHRGIIVLGVLFKLAYGGTVLGHFFLASIPLLWTWFAWIDLVFAAAFVAALVALRSASTRA